MTVEPAQVDRIDRSASRAAYPQEPIARPNGGAGNGRKNHGRAECLALIPGRGQAPRILEHLGIGRAPGRGFLLRGVATLILHLAAIKRQQRATRYLFGIILESDKRGKVGSWKLLFSYSSLVHSLGGVFRRAPNPERKA